MEGPMTTRSVGSIAVLAISLYVLPGSAGALGPEVPATRSLVDTVGFSHTAGQIQEVVRLSEEAESETLTGSPMKGPWVAALCPHDDHVYAGRVYVHVMPGIQARTVLVVGVAHRARTWGIEDQLIFDAFDSWRGPFGPIRVSPVRDEILEHLAPEDYVVSNEFHAEEHSIEGLLPFLQHYNREAEIVPVLVPYMEWGRLDELARRLADVLADIAAERHWVLGQDLAILISVDCVHYGDEGWGGKDYAPFGSDGRGYDLAVARERDLIETHLAGSLHPAKLEALFLRLVDDEDVREYRITWCGRFSVPFGLDCQYHLSRALDLEAPRGVLLRYGTSVELGRLALDHLGIGVTAPVSLHHWVGYAAVGYR